MRARSIAAPPPASSSSSSAQRKARSPARIAALVPNQPASGWPDGPGLAAARVTWAAGAPRRVAERSITSSWSRAKVWRSSTAAATVTTRSSRAAPVAAWPQCTKAGRSRLPPRSTSRRTASAISPTPGSAAPNRTRAARTKASKRSSTGPRAAARACSIEQASSARGAGRPTGWSRSPPCGLCSSHWRGEGASAARPSIWSTDHGLKESGLRVGTVAELVPTRPTAPRRPRRGSGSARLPPRRRRRGTARARWSRPP